MRRIKLTDQTMTMIRQATAVGHEFQQHATLRPDGDWDVPLAEETIERLEETMLEGDSHDDATSRLLREYLGHLPN